MSTKLTQDILISLGFKKRGKGITGRPLYRKRAAKYAYYIQVELGDYPETNPNCGIVSIFSPESMVDMFDSSIDKDSLDIIDDQEEIDGIMHYYGRRYIKWHQLNQPVAWYVDTVERLKEIHKALTRTDL